MGFQYLSILNPFKMTFARYPSVELPVFSLKNRIRIKETKDLNSIKISIKDNAKHFYLSLVNYKMY